LVSIKKAQLFDLVTFEYVGKLEDGTIFETSSISGQLTVVLGEKQLLFELEKAFIGMQEGERKTVAIPWAQAYGARKKRLILEIGKERFPADLHPKAGMKLLLRQKEGKLPTQIEILSVSKNTVTIDANHPLAGHNLFFEIKVVHIEKRN